MGRAISKKNNRRVNEKEKRRTVCFFGIFHLWEFFRRRVWVFLTI